jgi:hypothetical protein
LCLYRPAFATRRDASTIRRATNFAEGKELTRLVWLTFAYIGGIGAAAGFCITAALMWLNAEPSADPHGGLYVLAAAVVVFFVALLFALVSIQWFRAAGRGSSSLRAAA